MDGNQQAVVAQHMNDTLSLIAQGQYVAAYHSWNLVWGDFPLGFPSLFTNWTGSTDTTNFLRYAGKQTRRPGTSSFHDSPLFSSLFVSPLPSCWAASAPRLSQNRRPRLLSRVGQFGDLGSFSQSRPCGRHAVWCECQPRVQEHAQRLHAHHHSAHDRPSGKLQGPCVQRPGMHVSACAFVGWVAR